VTHHDPTVVNAREALELATRRGAEAIHWDDEIGSLEIGKRADLILVDFQKPHLTPMYDAISHLVYAARSSDVQAVIVNGQVIVENRICLTLNQQSVIDRANQYRDKIRQALK
jgi:5-methylthioadenosine/S-adenosylhomocysteine deaminase